MPHRFPPPPIVIPEVITLKRGPELLQSAKYRH